MAATALRKVKRSWWGEVMYRLDWLFWGGVAAVAVAFIPLIGWFMSVGIVGLILWKVFGFREVVTEGDCPVCTKGLRIDPKKDDVIACPVCRNVLQVQPDRLELLDIRR
ncbi:Mpv17/PMP22 family protein [Pseudomonas aeruginosa]|uniref:Mpv17/PMP22 family protein n=1 Tax=Pseudomonas aeruginosa group TaxID=136841 RepID=UPI000709EEA6|nr:MULTISPECIES: Mpv17/PMP22 family protein [Pseudomonas aeruginosa group]MDG9855669.1 Mpv17/PMP22 family protein [Pseudomonas nitroreducens]